MASSETPHRGKSRAKKGPPMSPLEKRAVSGLRFILGLAIGIYGILWCMGSDGRFSGRRCIRCPRALSPVESHPPIPHNHQQRMGSWRDALRIFKHPPVLTASIGIFILQMVLGAGFVVLSPELVNAMHIPDAAVWEDYPICR
ncbi:MAG: hypothetical protein ACYCY0_05325 [Acidithiobacillus ferrivorans]